MKLGRVFFLAFFIFLLTPAIIYADIFYSPTWEYWLDLPEGFELEALDGDSSFLFKHSMIYANVIAKTYPTERFSTAQEGMNFVMNQFSATTDICPINYRNSECIVSSFQFTSPEGPQNGWGIASPLSNNKGIVIILAYSPEQYASDCEQFLISCVDSLCIDRGSWYEAGPITALGFPQTGLEKHQININDEKIDFNMDSSDTEADRFVIEREYAVLELYKSSELWKEAWQRYYRQIFRNAYKRTKNAAFKIYETLASKTGSDKIKLTNTLLHWVQNFEYRRDHSTTDFTPVTEVLLGTGSDCDSRSMLLSILLSQMNIKTCMFVSAEYSHAILGVELDTQGAGIELNGSFFVLGETTAHVDLGLISSEMNDTNKWIGVDLSF